MDELPYLCSVKKRKQELDLPSFHFPSYLTQAAKGQLQRLDPTGVLRISGLYGSALAPLVAELHGQSPLLVLLRDEEEAGYLYSDLEQLLGREAVLFFPSAYRRALRYGHRDEAQVLLRSMVLSRLSEEGGRLPILISYPEAVQELVPPMREASYERYTLRQGQLVDRDELRDRLLGWGFERVDYVYEPGQFAIRGSIFDIYSFSSELPYRLDFFDDELESLRLFEVDSQLSVD